MFDDQNELRDVVLVIGANQFVAQHIIKLLHENDDHVDEIRVWDSTPYENQLGKVLQIFFFNFSLYILFHTLF